MEKIKKQLVVFCAEEQVTLDTDILAWWRVHEERFPDLAPLARKYLCFQVTSVPSEIVFSAAGVLVNKLRSSLSPADVDALIFLQKNKMLRSARHYANTTGQSKEEVDRRDVLEEEVEAAGAV